MFYKLKERKRVKALLNTKPLKMSPIQKAKAKAKSQAEIDAIDATIRANVKRQTFKKELDRMSTETYYIPGFIFLITPIVLVVFFLITFRFIPTSNPIEFFSDFFASLGKDMSGIINFFMLIGEKIKAIIEVCK